jgi:hypothetical protein
LWRVIKKWTVKWKQIIIFRLIVLDWREVFHGG